MFAEGAVPDPSGQLLQYGILGIFACLMIYALGKFFKIMQESSKRETARADRAEEQNRLLNEMIRDKVIPELTRAADANSRVLALFDERRP